MSRRAAERAADPASRDGFESLHDSFRELGHGRSSMHDFSDLRPLRVLGVALGALSFAAPGAAQNVIVNGDFEAGNTGFASGYAFGDDTESPGTYCVADDPVVCAADAADFHDHTSGTGNMMIVDGSQQPRTVVWKQRVAVAPDTVYLLAGWAASWGRDGDRNVDPSPAVLRFRVGYKVGHFKVDPHDGAWKRFEFPWKSGPTQTSATITITDVNRSATGNDFALDDLSFTPAHGQ
jgi:hypothetical protein